MSIVRLRQTIMGETMFPPCTPFFPTTRGTFRFPAPLHAHRPESGR